MEENGAQAIMDNVKESIEKWEIYLIRMNPQKKATCKNII